VLDKGKFSVELTFVTALQFVRQDSRQYNIMLLSFGFNFICGLASQGSFPISCYNSSQRI